MYCKVIICFLLSRYSSKTSHNFVHFKTKFEVHQTDFALQSIIYCFVSVSFNFSVLLCLFFHYRGGNERKVRLLYWNVAVYLRCSFMARVTGKFTDFPVCVIRYIFIRKLSHLTISSPFILINQKMHKKTTVAVDQEVR